MFHQGTLPGNQASFGDITRTDWTSCELFAYPYGSIQDYEQRPSGFLNHLGESRCHYDLGANSNRTPFGTKAIWRRSGKKPGRFQLGIHHSPYAGEVHHHDRRTLAGRHLRYACAHAIEGECIAPI